MSSYRNFITEEILDNDGPMASYIKIYIATVEVREWWQLRWHTRRIWLRPGFGDFDWRYFGTNICCSNRLELSFLVDQARADALGNAIAKKLSDLGRNK